MSGGFEILLELFAITRPDADQAGFGEIATDKNGNGARKSNWGRKSALCHLTHFVTLCAFVPFVANFCAFCG